MTRDLLEFFLLNTTYCVYTGCGNLRIGCRENKNLIKVEPGDWLKKLFPYFRRMAFCFSCHCRLYILQTIYPTVLYILHIGVNQSVFLYLFVVASQIPFQKIGHILLVQGYTPLLITAKNVISTSKP